LPPAKNLDSVNEYVPAYSSLTSAVDQNPDEPTFLDELSYNEAFLAASLFEQIQQSTDSALASASAEQKLNLQSPQLGQSVNTLLSKATSDSDKVVAVSPKLHALLENPDKNFSTPCPPLIKNTFSSP